MIYNNWKAGLIYLSLLLWLTACKQDRKETIEPVPEQALEAGETYAVTLDGKRLHAIPEPDSTKASNKATLNTARMNYLGNLKEVKPYLEYAVQSLKSGLIENALLILGKGIEQFPNTADLYLYRGIAAVQGRQFSAAINDFWKAGKAVEGQKNVKGLLDKTDVEKKIDATIHYEIYLWMGLAFQGQGDLSNAEKMYEVCGDFSTNSDLYCMSYYWQYQAYIRSGRQKDAERILATVEPKMYISAITKPYLDALLYLKGQLQEPQLIDLNKTPKSSIEAREWTIKAYAVALKASLDKNELRNKEVLEKIVEIPYWNQMAYIAAESDLHKIQGYDYKQMETKEVTGKGNK